MKAQKIAVAGVILLIVIGMVVAYKKSNNAVVQNDDGHNGEVPIFAWRFTQATTNNPDGNPQTNIFLDATYADGKTDAKLIEASNGSCNELPDAKDKDVLANTTIIQCYYAGQGFYYKIIKGEKSYQILRKEFEEGSDDYNPPEQEYKPIGEISF